MRIQSDLDENMGNMLTSMSGQISPEGGDPETENITSIQDSVIKEISDMENELASIFNLNKRTPSILRSKNKPSPFSP